MAAQTVRLIQHHTNRIAQDLHLVELEDYRHSGTNITAFRMVDPGRPEVQKVVEDYLRADTRFGASRKVSYPVGNSLRVRIDRSN